MWRSVASLAPWLLVGIAGAMAHTRSRRVLTQPDMERAQAVKDIFKECWTAYRENALPHDTLLPITEHYINDRNGWGVTCVDSLSTAIVMNEKESLVQIMDCIKNIDFDATDEAKGYISVFETNIRYLGGLLSGYDLLGHSFYRDLNSDDEQVQKLLELARTLANNLSIAFKTPSGLPKPMVQFSPERKNKGEDFTNPAEAGTLILEWERLSDITGLRKFRDLARKGQQHLMEPKGIPEARPGLVGMFLDTDGGKFTDNSGGWGALGDSFYEYLIKTYMYFPNVHSQYKDRWILAADSTMEHLASHPTTRENLTFLMDFNGKNTFPRTSHLAAFAGGNFLMAGVLLNSEKYRDFGLALTDSYYETYSSSPSGIGPEVFQWIDNRPESLEVHNILPPPEQEAFYSTSGFWTRSPDYYLRPEMLESLYFAYRVTGDKKYQDMAWDAFTAITTVCRAGVAYTAVTNVTQPDGGTFYDYMESFWMAETLKYAYLIFAEEQPVQFKADGRNEFVFNTEAHPLRLVDENNPLAPVDNDNTKFWWQEEH